MIGKQEFACWFSRNSYTGLVRREQGLREISGWELPGYYHTRIVNSWKNPNQPNIHESDWQSVGVGGQIKRPSTFILVVWPGLQITGATFPFPHAREICIQRNKRFLISSEDLKCPCFRRRRRCHNTHVSIVNKFWYRCQSFPGKSLKRLPDFFLLKIVIKQKDRNR